jgi:hypothetical protein
MLQALSMHTPRNVSFLCSAMLRKMSNNDIGGVSILMLKVMVATLCQTIGLSTD